MFHNHIAVKAVLLPDMLSAWSELDASSVQQVGVKFAEDCTSFGKS